MKREIVHSDIVIFERKSNRYRTSDLKTYLHFLSFQKVPRPYKFAHVLAEGSLISALSLKENILLNNSCIQLMHEKYDNLENKISKKENPFLLEILNLIGDLSVSPSEVCEEKKKLTALLKTLLRPADYLFLENPELNLSQKSLELVIQAMEHNSQNLGQITFITSPFIEIWSEIATKHVKVDPSGKFIIQEALSPKTSDYTYPENKKIASVTNLKDYRSYKQVNSNKITGSKAS